MNRIAGIAAFSFLMALVNANAQTSSPITVTGVVNNQLSSPPNAPTVQVVCGSASVSYQYEYVAVDAAGGTTGPSSHAVASFNVVIVN
jgi:hypothetical protein